MTNDVFCVGLTRTELQTLSVLLPITFPILSVEPDALDEDMIEHITDQVRCMVLNPKRLSVAQLTAFLYAQDELRVRYRPVPIILFSNTMTREQNREIPLPEYPVLVIDLHKRLDRNRNPAIRLLRESSLPCWQNRKTMRNNMFNDAWYLIDIETTGLDVWKDRIISIRLSKMANFEVHGQSTIYIRQPEPLPENITNRNHG